MKRIILVVLIFVCLTVIMAEVMKRHGKDCKVEVKAIKESEPQEDNNGQFYYTVPEAGGFTFTPDTAVTKLSINDNEKSEAAESISISNDQANSFSDILSIPSPSNIIIMNPEGKQAIIDFGGDKVTYSGDLPVDESAKIFFEYVFKKYINECKRG
jgi:biopolymer transport protein ExbD